MKPRKDRGMRNMKNEQKTNNKTGDLSSNKLIITLHVNGLNPPIKRQRLAEWL